MQDGLLLGWTQAPQQRNPIGFVQPPFPEPQLPEPIFFEQEGHLLTIGPTGAGKGVSCIIPALLTYPGPVIVIDPKGEACQVTARRRRMMGQQVIRLDPFGVTTKDTDALNPLDILNLPDLEPEDEARALTDLLAGGVTSLRDAFWDNTSQAFLSGLMSYLATSVFKEEQRLSTLRAMFGGNDLAYTIAKLLDEKKE